ncbi:biotin transporter BioY [Acuticoccus sp. MNP-M23]|uniref:biotin transporter BioY n=1 Tax=Acuticoccus sp. MNP-M23 TaxID=3072793 RepID=UPI002815316B|nr:biotin transporter BioY [Acuticoccus sp. MNP-M23]WMS42466.1 biotin transporter BioY [Acuticoccus sp. MNP-M23]
MNPSQTLLADRVWSQGLVRNITLAIVGSLALWLSAKIHVPFYPVPMTMQTFAVLVIGMAYGWRLGGATVLLYLAEGASGLPVFSGTPERGIGFAYMVGPTGGYLLGFVLAAVVTGFLAERQWDRRVSTTLLAMTLGTAIIMGTGVLWLGAVIGFDKDVLALGVTPFLLGAVFKIALASAVLPLTWHLLKRH